MPFKSIKEQALALGLEKEKIKRFSKSELIRYIQTKTLGIGCFGLDHRCQEFNCKWFKACTREAYENYIAAKTEL